MSAQCPACYLHALVPVHLLQREDRSWRQWDEKGALPAEAVTIDTCPVCFGAWFDQGEIDALGDGAVDALLRAQEGASAAPGGCASPSSGTWPDV